MSEYTAEHRATRAKLIQRYEAEGRGWPCHICGKPMTDPPRKLHLAHTHDRGQPHARATGGRGLAHARCNIGEAGRLGLARLRGADPRPRARRQW